MSMAVLILRAMALLAFGGLGPPLGEETMERIRRREQRVYSKLGLGVRPVDLERTERTLRNIRKALAEVDARLGTDVVKERSHEIENA